MDYIVIPYDRKTSKYSVNFNSFMIGLPDAFIETKKHRLKLYQEIINVRVDIIDNHRIKKFKILPEVKISNQEMISLSLTNKELQTVPATDFILFNIDNNNFKDLQNFLKKYRDSYKKNAAKHTFNIFRINDTIPHTNLLVSPYFLLDLIINAPYSHMQFYKKVKKHYDNYYEINITDDIFFKNNLYLYIYKNKKIYYADRIQFKFTREGNENLSIFAYSDNDVEVSEDDIIDAYCRILISLIKSIKSKNVTNDIKTIKIYDDIINEYKETFGHHHEVFLDKIKKYTTQIAQRFESNYYLTIKASTLFE